MEDLHARSRTDRAIPDPLARSRPSTEPSESGVLIQLDDLGLGNGDNELTPSSSESSLLLHNPSEKFQARRRR